MQYADDMTDEWMALSGVRTVNWHTDILEDSVGPIR